VRLTENHSGAARAGAARKIRPAVRSILATVLAAAASVSGADAGNDGLKTYSIAPQAVSSALKVFAAQSGMQLIFSERDVGATTTSGVDGRLPPRESLAEILKGTGLEFEFTANDVVVVRKAASPAQATSFRSSMLDEAPAGQPLPGEEEPLQEVLVQGLEFRYEELTSATKLPLSVKDTPQSIKAVTEDVIEFSGIRQFEDVYKIDASGGTSHAIDDHARNYYRGFLQQSDNAIKVDGFRLTGEVNLDLAPFERFEIVKGATSTLYGQNSVAGTLNAITKRPQSRFGGEVRAELGDHDHYRADLDVYGPLSADDRLAYRFIGAYTDENSFLDLAGRKVALLAPALRLELSPGTVVDARVIYQESDARHHFGHGLLITDDGLREPDVPRSRFAGMDWNSVTRDALFVQTSLDHELAGDWKLRASLQYNQVDGELTEFIPVGLGAGGVALLDANYARNDEDEAYAGELNVYGDVEAFGRRHTLFVGVDHSQHDFDHVSATDFVGAAFDIYAPDPRLYPARPRITDYPALYGLSESKEESGITVQALLRPADPLTVSIGARHTRDEMTSRSRSGDMALLDDLVALPYGPADEVDTDEVTIQTGITYALTPDLNLYASYGETFEPQFGRVAGGGLIDPERGEAREVGLKGDFARRLSYSLAVFDMERDNISQADLFNPGFVVPLGTQRSRGVELDFQGDILPGWGVYGSFAWLDAEFTSGQFEGLQPVNAPRFGASLFTSYQIQGGTLRGLGFGGGLVHKRGRETFDEDDFGIFGATQVFDFGDFTEVDVRVFYNNERWRLQLAGTNLTDEKYYSPTFNNFLWALHVNPARAVTASVSYRF
jgi:TonB-dependent siderophore receptor